MELNPVGGRSYEPPGLVPSKTANIILNLLQFYKITGQRRYLHGIPAAIEWLENTKLPPGHSDKGHTHAQFIQVGTNKPLYAHREGTSREDGRYWIDYEPRNFPGHYGMQHRIDVNAIKTEYKRVSALTPEQAMAEHQEEQKARPAVPEVPPEVIQQLIASMDKRGAWIEELSVPDYTDWKYKPRRHFRGISTATYCRNMQTFMNYWIHNDQLGMVDGRHR